MRDFFADVFSKPDITILQGFLGLLILSPFLILILGGLAANALFALYVLVESCVWISKTKFYLWLSKPGGKMWNGGRLWR